MSLTAKIERHKTVKFNGVRYVIRKLTPLLFLDADYMLPISHLLEIQDEKKKLAHIEQNLDAAKEKIQDIIIRGTVCIRCFWRAKPILPHIESIMGQPDLYTFLMSEIIIHTLSVKKKPSN